MALPHCPHCRLPIGDGSLWPYPQQPERCPHCRLLIGPGRARDRSGDDGDARSRGSAAGVLANAARRQQGDRGDPATILTALRHVAEGEGCAVERLRMLDYQEATEREGRLPALAVVLATFTTWKSARQAAGVVQEPPTASAQSV